MVKKKSGREKMYDAVRSNIYSIAARDGSVNTLANISKRTAIPTTTLSHKMRNPRTITLDDIYTIAYTYDVSPTELFAMCDNVK